MWNRLALNLASHLSDHKRAFAVTRAALQDFEVFLLLLFPEQNHVE